MTDTDNVSDAVQLVRVVTRFGLAFNRHALGALASRLAQAEAVLGRVGLPGEASGQTMAPLGA